MSLETLEELAQNATRAAEDLADKDSASYDPAFARAMIDGLSRPRKATDPSFFYDTRGSELFEDITQLEEYYPTRSEVEILTNYAPEMAKLAGPHAVVVEFGSGSSRKTPLLLAALEKPAAYVPIDIAEEFLIESSRVLQRQFPHIPVHPKAGDFYNLGSLPKAVPANAQRVGFFPGSTLGNMTPDKAVEFLENVGDLLGDQSRLIIGIDLVKDRGVLTRAYDDKMGVTADFNLNLLLRMNNELGADFDLSKFTHKALFNEKDSRIEMHLVSTQKQTVTMLGHSFTFDRGETIHTENSYKYSLDSFRKLAEKAGWKHEKVWLDKKKNFSVHCLRRG